MSLIVTGTLGIDTIETPRGGAERVPGGSAAYFAAAANAQGPVRLVGAVGEDWPAEHRSLLESFTTRFYQLNFYQLSFSMSFYH